MDIRKVKKLIELLEASDVAEIEIKEGDETVRISRSSVSNPHFVEDTNAKAPVHRDIEVDEPSKKQTIGHSVKSPMVGTFYRAPSPSSAPPLAPNPPEEPPPPPAPLPPPVLLPCV